MAEWYGVCWRWLRSWKASPGGKRHGSPAWIARRCVIGCIATMKRAWRGFEEGVAGLQPRAIPGRSGKLTEEQMAQVRTMMVLEGPGPDVDGVIR